MKRNLLLALLLSLSLIGFSQTPSWQWAVGASGTLDDWGEGVATDAAGNVYSCGYFSSPSINFGGQVLTSAVSGSICCAKQDNAGNVIWTKNFSNTDFTVRRCSDICSDKKGYIYITGTFHNTTTIGATNLTATGYSDIFLAKIDYGGNVIWARKSDGTSRAYAGEICVDKLGNIYVAGTFHDAITFGTTTLTNSSAWGYADEFIAKFDPAGNAVWAKSINGKYSEDISDISADSVGNLYAIGAYVDSTISFGTLTLTNSVSDHSTNDIFIVKYGVSGNPLWAQTAGDFDQERTRGIFVDNFGNVHATGSFEGASITFGTHVLMGNGVCNNTFIIKFDGNYNYIWGRSFGYQGNNEGDDITADEAGNTIVLGDYANTLTIGTTSMTSAGAVDIYVAKFDLSGNPVFALSAGGSHFDLNGNICYSAPGNCYVTGYFFSPTAAWGSNILTNNTSPSTEIYVAKIGIPLGVNEVNEPQADFEIFPNPFNSQSCVIFKEAQNQACIRIFDAMGKLHSISNFSGKQFLIEKGDLEPGIYFVQITDEYENVTNRKIVIQ